MVSTLALDERLSPDNIMVYEMQSAEESRPENEFFSCKGRPEGLYPHLENKSVYYKCYQDTKRTYHCSQGYVFNSISSKCEDKKDVANASGEDAAPCELQSDGFYANYTDNCLRYYRCQNNELVQDSECNPGLRFDWRLEECVESDVSCVAPECPSSGSGGHLFTLPGTDCRAYFRCQKGTRIDVLCPPSQHFDAVLQTCVTARSTCHDPACSGRPDGTFADSSHECYRYVECRGGQMVRMAVCPQGQRFDGEVCRDEGDVTCLTSELATGNIRGLECLGKPEGYYPDVDEGCRSYHLCRNGLRVTTLQCPAEMVFDGRRCIKHRAPGCPNGGFIPSKVDGEDNLTVDDSQCRGRPDGYHADTSTGCRDYFFCQSGVKVTTRTCAEGTLFSGKMCIPYPLVRCPLRNPEAAAASEAQRRREACKDKVDGYHIDYLSGCKEYFYCLEGGLLFRSRCEESAQVFNGKSCVDKSTFRCWGPEESADCTAKEDSFFQDRKSGCQGYYYCSNGYKVQLRCNDGQVFNRHRCVDSTEFLCQEEDPDSCEGKPDGYYQDAASACRSYFFCSRGLKITYICPGHLIFNGKECVELSQYKCPYETSQDCRNKTDGYHPDVSTGCHNYYYCLQAEKISTFSCEGNKVYDGAQCSDRSEHACTPTCEENEDGYHTEAETGCTTYYLCSSGYRVAEYQCPRNQVFDRDVKTCVDLGDLSGNYSCHTSHNDEVSNNHCRHLPNGLYQDYISGCQKYYFCINGAKTDLKCVGNQVFNGELCVDPSQYVCPMLDPSISCRDRADGDYQDVKSNCKNYYRCSHGLLVKLYECPNGEAFDGQRCVQESRVSCHTDTPTRKDPCREKQDGKYTVSRTGCQKYIICLKGSSTNHSCSNNQVFNGHTCVSPLEYRCPELSKQSFCPTSMLGYFADVASSCQQFHLCAGGLQIHTFNCPPGSLFSQEGQCCQPASDVKCGTGKTTSPSVMTNAIDCHHLPNGYYPVPGTQCRSYMVCVSGASKIQSCPDGQVFDFAVRSCVTVENNTCPGATYTQYRETPSCAGKTDGSHIVRGSRCQNFYICSQGRSVICGACLSGQLYDSQTSSCRDYNMVDCNGNNID